MDDDTISRQAAIDALETVKSCLVEEEHQFLDCLISDMKKLPSAERRGRWIVLGERIENQTFDECKCSECGCVEYFNKGWKHFNYCPTCGSFNGEDDCSDCPAAQNTNLEDDDFICRDCGVGE